MAHTARPRRPERVITLTDDIVKNLPRSVSYTDVWYDTEVPNLVARNFPQVDSKGPRLLMLNGRRECRGAEIEGTKLARLAVLKSTDVAAAREEVRAMQPQLEAWGKAGMIPRGRTKGSRLQRVYTGDAASILNDREKVENPNYDKLMSVLMDAFQQASSGKGEERHGGGIGFEDQDMLHIMDRVGPGFGLGQAIKKLVESQKLKGKKARDELLGAIVYAAGTIVWMDGQ